MKKLLLFVLGLFASTLFGCSPMGMTIRSSGGASFIGNTINSVFGLDLGPATSVSIGNVTPFYTEVVILDREFQIEPSGFIHDSWHVEFDRSVLPVTVRFFTDPGRQNLIGVAVNVLGITNNQPTNWTIDRVSFLDGSYRSYAYISPYPQPDLGAVREVNIPRIKKRSININEIINGTLFDVVVRENRVKGRISDLLGINLSNGDSIVTPGGIYRSTTFDMYYSGRIIRQVLFVDRGRFVGYTDPIEFSVDPDGPHARQVILTPQSIKRY